MNIVFAGTGAFGIPALEALCERGHKPSLVLSQPDRPAGRKRVLTSPPLAARAKELGLELFQPEKLNRIVVRERIAEHAPDVLIVIAYGQILGGKVLAMPQFGCLNVHGSLLPRHRGASPIQASILHRDAETGVGVMQMDAGLDTGPVFASVSTPIGVHETAGELHDRLAAMGGELLMQVLDGLRAGTATATAQDERLATTCGLIAKDDGRLRFAESAEVLDAKIRAFTPWPGAFTFVPVRDKMVRVNIETAHLGDADAGGAVPGTVLEATGDRLLVATGAGTLALLRLRPAGKKVLDAAAFLRGYPVEVGARFSESG